MRINDFFDFSSNFVSSTVRARSIGLKLGDDANNIGDANRLVIGDYESIVFPVSFKQDQGKKFQDILDTARAFLFLISDRMKTVLEENNLTGWKCYPIRLLDKQGNKIEGYQGLSVTGRCGPIYVLESAAIYKRVVSEGPICKYYKGWHIGLDEWDGSDFFLPKRSYGMIVTAAAAKVIKSNKLTNVHLRNLAEIEVPEDAANVIKAKPE